MLRRRRTADYRRPVRSTFSCWIWTLLGIFFIAGFVLFVLLHLHDSEDHVEPQILDRGSRNDEVVHEHLNFTQEISSATSYARQLIEQMTLAKAYVVIAKERNNLHLAWKLSMKIRSCQLLLSKAAMRVDPISVDEAEPIIRSLSSLIFEAQDVHYDIATTMMTMKSHIQALEERANAASVQSTAFGRLLSESLPKSLHCLDIALTTDWIKKVSTLDLADKMRSSPRLGDNNLYHFCVFSDNVMAVSAVVNSTISNANHSQQFVFHIVTNRVHYGAMHAWFLSNDFRGCTIEIQNIEDFTWLNNASSHSYPLVVNQEDHSLLSQLRFYIPEIYPQLEKVVFLEDDVVVQKDLTPLFSLDLHGNVNGAVETCLEAYHRFYKYLNFSNPLIGSKFDPQACGWAFGVNIFDLIGWRRANVTGQYHYWQEQNREGSIWKDGTNLPPALLAFYGMTEPLDRRWHVQGFGHDAHIDKRLIESAAVIHFNGNMKPWLNLGFSNYKPLWERYVNQSNPYITGCVNR
ncbi:unnamed protein product [Cuscuta epithymum]|uniref:Hexosyltransferase n=1 Tax=Cuscuta epithymum TaxID=186058 RepID=A0AAV0D9P4_9ASTE|nr:unnamed protein product [Cuscuta epithymum]